MVPYIGMTDLHDRDEAGVLLRILRDNRKSGSNRRLHVGVMVSPKTLGPPFVWGRGGGTFPKAELVEGIFSREARTGVYNCLHYADFKKSEPEDLRTDLLEAIRISGPNLHAIQLDMTWPDVWAIRSATEGKGIEVILQVGAMALQDIHNDPNRLVTRLESYDGSIHRVLLDGSGGRGIPLQAEVLLPLLRAVARHLPHCGLVVAGGLGPETLGLLAPIAAEFPNISIDAQGQLRASGRTEDRVELPRMEAYLRKALALLA